MHVPSPCATQDLRVEIFQQGLESLEKARDCMAQGQAVKDVGKKAGH
jgi:hypothetical protein